MTGLRLVNILLILGTTVALLVSMSPSQMISASVEGSTTVPNTSKSNQGAANPNQQAIDHINQAQSSLQSGDTAGAQMHMDLAKQALICNPGDPTHC